MIGVLNRTGDQILNPETPFRVTDLKQWVYCPRVLFYTTCMPDVRPVTYKMESGIESGQSEEGREVRRSLRSYGLKKGRREFNVAVTSDRLGLRGTVDMVVWVYDDPHEQIIPVDYKLSRLAGEHFKLQLVAYGMMLEEIDGGKAQRGFLYSIPLRKAEEVHFNQRLRDRLVLALESMHRMLWAEAMPAPTPQRNKCLACEFRRFCNDVI